MELFVVAMEACGGAYFWGRQIGNLGHNLRLIPPLTFHKMISTGLPVAMPLMSTGRPMPLTDDEADIAALAALLTEAEAQSPATALSDEPAMTRFRRCRITRSISTARAAKPCSCPTCRAKASRSA